MTVSSTTAPRGQARPCDFDAYPTACLQWAAPGEELPPVHQDDPDAEPKLKQRLKRHIVERCIYGVDLNSLAVELAKLAVWVETLDRNLPFGFLDHKLRCGKALVGCWLDRVDDYPILAWDREGGDGKAARRLRPSRKLQGGQEGTGEQLFSGSAWIMATDHNPPRMFFPKPVRPLGRSARPTRP